MAKSNNPHTPSTKPNQTHLTYPKTPQTQTKQRLNYKDTLATAADHPVEVIGRIRDHPDRKEKPVTALQVNPDRRSLRVKTEIGYRDFTLDGVSMSEEEGLDGFYEKFVEPRINGVKLGAKCTIMMYGPTGSGKSHTMFGCAKQQGIVYKSLRDILGEEGDGHGSGSGSGVGLFVQVTVLEIYNEEIYDLLSTNSGGGLSLGWPKGSGSKVRLEVMGKKAKNATFIYGNEAAKISKEIQKVEKRRIVKSTLCNERSSRSHCMIILDVPTVGGRLMLVDMAGSENIEQAGQIGVEAKMQTAKINQGNIALKRVVESIANGDSHVPFRDSKLTMLLQDSFEDDKSKILMILCASPDPKEMHKTITTLEYGAKAKCIVRGPHTPLKDKNGTEDTSSAVTLGSRIEAMEQFIVKLQTENKLREKERNEANKEVRKKEEEVSALRAKLALGPSEEEINLKVNERAQMLKCELEKKIQECEQMANDFVEIERRKMEERILEQQKEVETLRRRLAEIELELYCSRGKNGQDNGASLLDGSSFAKRLLEIYSNEDPGMEKSMDLDKSMDFDTVKKEPLLHDAKNSEGGGHNIFDNKVSLSTVLEEGEEVVEHDEEVRKEVIEEKRVYSSRISDSRVNCTSGSFTPSPQKRKHENAKESSSSRRKRIQNIFTLCGNYRELSQHNGTTFYAQKRFENFDPHSSPLRTIGEDSTAKKSLNDLVSYKTEMNKVQDSKELAMTLKENSNPLELRNGDSVEVYVKWEVSKEHPEKFITTLKVVKDATLAELRKLIEIHLAADKQAFMFLGLGDPTGAPVPREKEATIHASKLPSCNQSQVHLACLRPIIKQRTQGSNHLPLSPLQNMLNVTAR